MVSSSVKYRESVGNEATASNFISIAVSYTVYTYLYILHTNNKMMNTDELSF